jgi:hypothetical protein
MHTGENWSEILKERNHLVDLKSGRKIILKRILREYNVIRLD